MFRVPMTREGFEVLQEELKNLKGIQRPAIIKAIASARELGDLSENAEYHAAREKQSMIEGRIATLEEKLGLAEVIDSSSLNGDRVQFGATVSLEDCESEERKTYRIVGEIESDVSQGRLSVQSPMAKALIGKRVGDIVQVVSPQGGREYEILQLDFSNTTIPAQKLPEKKQPEHNMPEHNQPAEQKP